MSCSGTYYPRKADEWVVLELCGECKLLGKSWGELKDIDSDGVEVWIMHYAAPHKDLLPPYIHHCVGLRSLIIGRADENLSSAQ